MVIRACNPSTWEMEAWEGQEFKTILSQSECKDSLGYTSPVPTPTASPGKSVAAFGAVQHSDLVTCPSVPDLFLFNLEARFFN